MMMDTRWGGEARNDRRLLVNLVQAGVGETKSSTPAWEAFSRRQRVNRERPNPNPNIIKCFDLSLSWFLEVPRADLSVPPHLLPSIPPAFVSYTVYKVYLGLVLLSVHASTSLEEDHGYVSVDLPKSRKGE